ncbi:MAG: putative metal-binding motif-containing protein, partial [Flavisolibacter sp.]
MKMLFLFLLFSLGIKQSVYSQCEKKYYYDYDKDGYGTIYNPPITAVTPPPGYVTLGGDCDDQDASIHPNAPEICDGHDNDCDGYIDDGISTLYYRDLDGDGYGDKWTGPTSACTPPAGYVTNNKDCDDGRPEYHPGASDPSDDLLDQNCDIINITVTKKYLDSDGDGYGGWGAILDADANPPPHLAQYKFVFNLSDCDDNDPGKHPGATEICDGKDNDCNGLIDDGIGTTFYHDWDGDGYGDVNSPGVIRCFAGGIFVANNSDCNDRNAAVFPGAPEICDGLDNNCDGLPDEG